MENQNKIQLNKSTAALLLIIIGVIVLIGGVFLIGKLSQKGQLSITGLKKQLNVSGLNEADSQRIQDLNKLNEALRIISREKNIPLGLSNTIYVSLPDSSAICANLKLPALPHGWSYACVPQGDYQKADGSGWLPVDFSSLTKVALSNLPVDPINNAENGFYYMYTAEEKIWEIDTFLENRQNKLLSSDKGDSLTLYETGSALTLFPINDRGLMGFWNFDDRAAVVVDSSGNGNHGRMFNGPQWKEGKKGNSLSFDQSLEQFVLIPFNVPLTAFSVSAWIDKTTWTNKTTQGHAGLITSNLFRVQVMPPETKNKSMSVPYIQFNSEGGSGFFGGREMALNQWNHIAVTFDGNFVHWYLNGRETGVFEKKPVILQVLNLRIGADGISGLSPVADYMDGKIDEVRMYNRALSPAEIGVIYNSTK